MSSYRDLMKKGDADHSQLTSLEFILYVNGKTKGGDPVTSEAATELAALRARVEMYEKKLTKVLSWFEIQAKAAKECAETTRHESMREAYKSDEKNFSLMATDVAAVLKDGTK
jgi:hypothetical protein